MRKCTWWSWKNAQGIHTRDKGSQSCTIIHHTCFRLLAFHGKLERHQGSYAMRHTVKGLMPECNMACLDACRIVACTLSNILMPVHSHHEDLELCSLSLFSDPSLASLSHVRPAWVSLSETNSVCPGHARFQDQPADSAPAPLSASKKKLRSHVPHPFVKMPSSMLSRARALSSPHTLSWHIGPSVLVLWKSSVCPELLSQPSVLLCLFGYRAVLPPFFACHCLLKNIARSAAASSVKLQVRVNFHCQASISRGQLLKLFTSSSQLALKGMFSEDGKKQACRRKKLKMHVFKSIWFLRNVLVETRTLVIHSKTFIQQLCPCVGHSWAYGFLHGLVWHMVPSRKCMIALNLWM